MMDHGSYKPAVDLAQDVLQRRLEKDTESVPATPVTKLQTRLDDASKASDQDAENGGEDGSGRAAGFSVGELGINMPLVQRLGREMGDSDDET